MIKVTVVISLVLISMLSGAFIAIKKVNKNGDITGAGIGINTESNLKEEAQPNSDEVKKEQVQLQSKPKPLYIPLEEDLNADDVSIVVPNVMYNRNCRREDGRKVAYLTFDDGPSSTITPQILDVLDNNNVKATFFVLGSTIEKNQHSAEILKRMAKNGHAIANHGYSHDYKYLYTDGWINVDNLMHDMEKNLNLLKSILGNDFNTRLMRLPGGYGGKNGITPFNEALDKRGWYQSDWNALNGDAEGAPKNPQQLLEELKKTIGNKETVIILMHDTYGKENTVAYLQSAIDYLKSEGFELRTLK